MTPCPTCKKTATKHGNKFYPFCGERCRLIDLARWLDEEYRVPAEPDTSGGGSESSNPRDDER